MTHPEGEVLTEEVRTEMLSEGHNSQEFLSCNSTVFPLLIEADYHMR